MEVYLTDENYDALVEALVALEPNPVTGQREPHDVRLVLGEAGNVWPARIEATHDRIP